MQNAIGMVEFSSIARGIVASDQMVKAADVVIVTAVTVCPGKYISIVTGDVASVKNAVEVGQNLAAEYLVDAIVIPNVSAQIFPAISGTTAPESVQALGIVECFSMAAMVIAADAILKAAELEAIELRMGNGLGGKAYFTFTGDVGAVQAGVAAGKEEIREKGLLVNAEVIPAPSDKLVPSLL